MELPERFAHGDLDAFEALFRQFQGDVYRWIVRIVRDPGAAEDLTVETFWRTYRARSSFDPAREFGAWARRIATNAAIDYLRSARPMQELPRHLAGPAAPGPEIQEAIQRAFRQLPARLQAVAAMALIEETPYAEIAAALGISVGAVKTREFRAVRLLRKKLKRMGMEP